MDLGSILAAFAVFLFVVLFHELGHFIAAKSVGIKVNEFAVGMGPAILKRQRGETEYSLRLLPLGGYCAMEGEDENSDDPRGFEQAKPLGRFLTIFAGPFMNILIAILVFTFYTAMIGKPVPIIKELVEGSPLAQTEIEPGDRILSINGQELTGQDHLKDLVRQSEGNPIEIEYETTSGNRKNIQVQPKEENGQYLLGFIAETTYDDFFYFIRAGWMMTWQTFISLFQIIGMLISGKLGLDAVSGPVAVISTIGQAAKTGLANLLYLTAYISVNLAFFNLLPIPALDGSKLVFILLEKLRGKPLNKETEGKITMVGFIFLLSLIFLVSIKDIMALFQ